MATNPPTGFFSLPAELRNHIYTLAFADSITGIGTGSEFPVDYHIYSSYPRETPQYLPPLLLASKATRNETLAIWLESTTFVVTVGEAFLYWLQRLNPRLRSVVRRVCVAAKAQMIDNLYEGSLSRANGGSREHFATGFALRGFEHKCRAAGISGLEFEVLLWRGNEREVIWRDRGDAGGGAT